MLDRTHHHPDRERVLPIGVIGANRNRRRPRGDRPDRRHRTQPVGQRPRQRRGRQRHRRRAPGHARQSDQPSRSPLHWHLPARCSRDQSAPGEHAGSSRPAPSASPNGPTGRRWHKIPHGFYIDGGGAARGCRCRGRRVSAAAGVAPMTGRNASMCDDETADAGPPPARPRRATSSAPAPRQHAARQDPTRWCEALCRGVAAAQSGPEGTRNMAAWRTNNSSCSAARPSPADRRHDGVPANCICITREHAIAASPRPRSARC